MKTTLVPAQVTTVEDKIAGSLGLQQLFLLAAPIFISGGLYIAFPPLLKLSSFKIAISILILLICALSAIRIKGQILLIWAIIIIRYNLRPRYFVFNKNDSFLRIAPKVAAPKPAVITKNKITNLKPKLHYGLPTSKLVRLEGIIADPRANLSFQTTKKGGLSVHITEVD